MVCSFISDDNCLPIQKKYKLIKRNKSSIITEWELKRMLPIIVREIDTNKIKQSEQKLTKWFAY